MKIEIVSGPIETQHNATHEKRTRVGQANTRKLYSPLRLYPPQASYCILIPLQSHDLRFLTDCILTLSLTSPSHDRQARPLTLRRRPPRPLALPRPPPNRRRRRRRSRTRATSPSGRSGYTTPSTSTHRSVRVHGGERLPSTNTHRSVGPPRHGCNEAALAIALVVFGLCSIC